jgi:hypothetical protein
MNRINPTVEEIDEATVEINRLYGITVGAMIHGRDIDPQDWEIMCALTEHDKGDNVGHVSQELARLLEVAKNEKRAARVRAFAAPDYVN